MRLAALAIPLLMLVVPFNSLSAKKPGYWDYFREPEQKRASGYDIEFALTAAGPLSDKLGEEVSAGGGFLFGFHYQIKFFRAGLDLGMTLFPGIGNEGPSGKRRTDYFVSIPLYCDLAFDIRLARIFSLVPFVSLGFSIDALKFIPSPSSVFDQPDYETLVTLHQAHRLGLGFWFHLNKSYSLQITAAYVPLLEYGEDMTVLGLIQVAVGFARRF
ncbi:MAG TPA: hypothetical protein PK573_14980 [Spirochaetota bacterium]|nr:hypothetical protein [Spirochaetota bacterium]HRZ25655.1 hypothetical protein [Spirochaetota bacterium]